MLKVTADRLCCYVMIFLVICCHGLETADKDHQSSKEPAGKPHYDEEGSHDDDYDHDAITGSHKETLEYKELSPEESQKRLAVLITRMDENKDGNVDKHELTKWIVQSLRDLDSENANNRIDEHDKNNDKQVSWEEYLQTSHGYSLQDVKELENSTSDDVKQLRKSLDDSKLKFDLADSDKDGILNIHEYTIFTHSPNYPQMAPYEVKRTLEDYDTNKDGAIDMIEYMGREKLDEETEKAEKDHFLVYDKDKNGKLDPTEIPAWIMPSFEPTAQSEAEHLIAETDADKNGLLSKDEILKQTELWVGSQATDYGKHLDDMKRDEL